MTDPLFFASTILAESAPIADKAAFQSTQPSQLEQPLQRRAAVEAERKRLDQLLLKLRSRPQAEASQFAPEFSQPAAVPASGSQLYQQRLAKLRSRHFTRSLPAPRSLADRQAMRQPTYDHWRSLLAQEAIAAAKSKHRSIGILLGDSLSLWFPSDRLPPKQSWLNQSISGDTTSDILRRLSAFATTRPRVVYIMAGINDLKNGASDQEVLANLRRILVQLRQTHPDAQIVMQSILPTRALIATSDRIQQMNQQLKAIALQQGAYYLDLFQTMADANGNLRADLTTDGLHLNAKGYQTWQAALQQAEIRLAQRF